ncbi:IS110 family transposase [Absiella sp. AM29-15]|uniref:IS110 family transposase n=1 Tax=Absiella sp. AM29-15 TaxID=2292278 RepID=UPI000E4266F4|nr:IS110 family transposase [Absiella sp. AM29-15]RGC45066.1 IS110 family transposase [Absiella sp. AM29-15]
MRRVMYPIACGIDVHKKKLACTIVIAKSIQDEPVYHHRNFSTHNYDLVKLADWLTHFDCHCVCMESTGKYWTPVFNYLEDRDFDITITHPKYVKSPKGKKTDFLDSIHIADLFQMGEVQPSYIPDKEFRQLRDLSRYRYKITNFISSEKNRIQNCQTMSNITLASVVSDPFGVSASAVFSELLISPDFDDAHIRSLLRGSLKKKSEEVLNSIRGFHLGDDQSFKALLALAHKQFLAEMKTDISSEISKRLSKYQPFIDLALQVPGIGYDSATTIIAEVGVDMSVFPDAENFTSWIGLTPTNNESADKKKSVRTSHAGTYLKPTLIQCALAALKVKKCPYFKIKYDKIKKRRGHKHAIIAIARMMAACLYHMFKDLKDFHPSDYEELMNPHPPKPRKQDVQAALELLQSAGGYTITPITAAS